MHKIKYLCLLFFTGFIFFGCEKDSSPKEQDLEVDAVLSEQSTFGWELNDLVNTGKDAANLTMSSEMLTENYSDPFSVQSMKQKAVRLAFDAGVQLSELSLLAKPLTDSLIAFEDDTLNGIRGYIYYDFDTGIATLCEVKYKFMEWRPMIYDSAAIVVDINFTFDVSTDDSLRHLYQQQLFKESFFIQKIIGELQVTDYDGTDITGAIASIDTYYHPARFLQHLTQSMELNPDQSGTLREDFEFRDNTTAFRSVTFYANYTGEFSKQLRDGTQINGTFNRVEDDGEGWYNEQIDFPAGRYLDKIIKSAMVQFTQPNTVFTAEFAEQIFFSSGRIDSIQIAWISQNIEGMRITTLEVHKANGAHGSFTVHELDGESVLTGNWTTWNEYYILIDAEYYFDNSAHIHYEVYAPPYNEGDDPILVADYDISPDGSGSGTITYQGEVYEVSFDGLDQAVMTRGGKRARINLFQ
jgi:hypothetical protein